MLKVCLGIVAQIRSKVRANCATMKLRKRIKQYTLI